MKASNCNGDIIHTVCLSTHRQLTAVRFTSTLKCYVIDCQFTVTVTVSKPNPPVNPLGQKPPYRQWWD